MPIATKQTYSKLISNIIALYISNVYFIIYDNDCSSISLYDFSPLNENFRGKLLLITMPLLSLFCIFNLWKGHWIRKILIPSIIMGYLFYAFMHFAIAWVAPQLNWQQKLWSFGAGVSLYLVYYGSYILISKWITKLICKTTI